MRVEDPKLLVRRLTPTATRMLERAVGIAASKQHYEITAEHFLLSMLEQEDGDAAQILHHFGQDRAALITRVEKSLQYMRSGNGGRPTFSQSLFTLMEDAWLTGSLQHMDGRIRSGIILYCLINRPGKYSADEFQELDAIPAGELKEQLHEVLSTTVEAVESAPNRGESGGSAPSQGGEGAPRGDSALAKFCTNFTEDARAGRIDPIFGRHKEIRQMCDILSRRRKNNPIIVGEPGVGKTALAEGLALAIVNGQVPAHISNAELLGLDMGTLQAGASVKGEFENRLKAVISEVKASPKPIILFIDEAHTLIGAGGQKGGSDAANLLKPALARGELRTVAATTWAEYKKYFEKDAALERRFQPVKVDEPEVDTCIVMLRGLKHIYEKAHNIRIQDDAVIAAAKLSSRYISGRQLPDKAVDLLDMSAARVRVARFAKPAPIEELEQDIAARQREEDAITRDIDDGKPDLEESLQEVRAALAEIRAKRDALLVEWSKEKEALEAVIAARLELDSALQRGSAKDADAEANAEAAEGEADESAEASESAEADSEGEGAVDEAKIAELKKKVLDLTAALEEVGGDKRMMHAEVDEDAVAKTVAAWTGIPVGSMQKDNIDNVLSLEENLGKRVIGQEYAISAVAETLRIANAGIRDPNLPVGVMLFVGTSGVGKTETALALADLFYGGERFMTTINMSEYQEKHTVSRLVGSPPGYVGYGEGGILTEAVRQRPYSVVLLDECEKADIEVMEIFYQVFDKGSLNDGEGRHIDFRNTMIILTSNIASEELMEAFSDGQEPDMEELISNIRPTMSAHFQAALLARMRIVPFRPIDPENMKKIARLKLNKLRKRITQSHGVECHLTDELIEEVARRCTEAETGARNIDHILRSSLMPRVAQDILEYMATGEEMPPRMEISLAPDGDWRIDFG